jgi:hypothetical protein
MTRKKAESLVQVDHSTLTEYALQKYKVQMLDAWRYAKGEYGYENDFFVKVPELRSYVPANYWLLRNIEQKLDLLGL